MYVSLLFYLFLLFFFFNDTATTEIYTLSLHDALPISPTIDNLVTWDFAGITEPALALTGSRLVPDRKSTRLNSSHVEISYAVFCLKKKKKKSSSQAKNDITSTYTASDVSNESPDTGRS